MALITLKPTIFTAVLALLACESAAFRPMKPTVARMGVVAGTNALKMAEGDPESIDKVQLTSNLGKEIMFDEKSGRFFETSLEAEECIPEEEFCTIDEATGQTLRLTLAEKERMFLDSLQSYYFSGRQVLSDEDFDKLKEDLQWQGSPVVALNRNEAQYLAAVEAYLKGKPMMDDKEFDNLKKELKESGSKFAVDTEPKCYIDTGVCKVTMQEDNFRNNLLYLPAGALIFIGWLGFGFEIIEPIIRLNPLILALLGSPLVYNGSKKITEEFIFENKKVVFGPCPSCEARQRVYFGNILGVEGFDQVAEVKCSNCKEMITVQRNTLRASTLPKAN